jgi:hypothetical protein
LGVGPDMVFRFDLITLDPLFAIYRQTWSAMNLRGTPSVSE